MMILGTGIDILSVARVGGLIAKSGERFLSRWFSKGEITYCASKARPSEHFAARLAAKEAVVKTLSPDNDTGVILKDIEIVDSGRGAPSVRLTGSALRIAESAGVAEVTVSLSHCAEYAVASAIALGKPPGGA